ncbi:thioesterase II family protein [Streptomyces meridianus]|uniref:Alpha/beta fold hydrolase n=1 Tax=Streptomyces meridianus TaxID=2938945 RepID=A0ABT0X0F3_9ACTN|nr:alpha/beta fold hydrolase [Streptomyces meridianus]MCM2576046.1 alpha/beta fold hydrolase [Streptomyces meridianus]
MRAATDEARWGRRYHPGRGATARLVCFPHAGGAASFFHPLSARLAPGTEVVAVQYPGRQDRISEQAPTDLATIADLAYAALKKLLSQLPTALFGHSMGALVAFEVARRMEADGLSPLRLFASGRAAPSIPWTGRRGRDDAEIVAELRELAGTDAALLADDELLQLILPAVRSDYAAVEGYRCSPGASVRCPVTALGGDDDPRALLTEVRAWQRHTEGGFDLKVFPGGHFYLVDQVSALIAELRSRLPGEEHGASVRIDGTAS